MQFKYVFLFSFLIWYHNGYATILSHIVDSEITNNGTNTIYEYSIDSWEPDSNALANPCYDNSSCVIGVSHRHGSDGTGSGMDPSATWTAMKYKCIFQAKDMNELRECLIKSGLSFPKTGTVNHLGDVVTDECVGLFYKFSGITVDSDLLLLPGSVCGLAPPPTGGCTLPESVTLDHGVLSSNNISGNTVSHSIEIQCNKEIDGKLYIEGLDNGVLDLGDNSIYSTLSINNTPVTDSGIHIGLVIGNNSVQIKSILATNGTPTTGNHQGQAIMILALE